MYYNLLDIRSGFYEDKVCFSEFEDTDVSELTSELELLCFSAPFIVISVHCSTKSILPPEAIQIWITCGCRMKGAIWQYNLLINFISKSCFMVTQSYCVCNLNVQYVLYCTSITLLIRNSEQYMHLELLAELPLEQHRTLNTIFLYKPMIDVLLIPVGKHIHISYFTSQRDTVFIPYV